MNKNCCHVVECNCHTNINCNGHIVNCKIIEICAINGGTKESCNIKMNEFIFEQLLKQINCNIGDQTYKIINSILIGEYIYIFIGTKRKTKNNNLCVLQGKININTKQIIDESFKLHRCYNIYNVVKNDILKENAMNTKIIQVSYNHYDDSFIILLGIDYNALFCKIDHLEAIHSIGTSLELITCKDTCNTLIIEHKPDSIYPLCKNKYRLVVIDNCTKCKKSINICL
jgi:hypothetical protein